MRLRPTIWITACLLLAGAWLLWRGGVRQSESKLYQVHGQTIVTASHSSSTAPNLLGHATVAASIAENVTATVKTNPFAYRLSNTSKSIGQLTGERKAILLANALIDTGAGANLSIPKHLQAQGDPGAYIVQAKGTIDPAFREMLARAGAEIISYIPNNAYLVKISGSGADKIKSSGAAQSVIAYEPYYKIQPSLLGLAVEQQPLPGKTILNLGLFSDGSAQTISQIEKLGGKILEQTVSPFGPVVRVQPPENWLALAALPGVQIVEPLRERIHANDLSRATV
ncbi:MAG TPA: hypothetical protein VN516_05240, partial [Candidatus Baltobacteraceae bacterium]|nr:hypothetical protein [Candidatus Baltobacteraceae bacterium]